jgi:hypothetical protein
VLARWTVTYGPEFEDSKREWRHRLPRFDMHLASIRLGLERDPYRYSTPFVDENSRVIESEGFFDGYTMTAYVRLDPERLVAEIKWVDLRRLEAEDDEDDDEEDVEET